MGGGGRAGRLLGHCRWRALGLVEEGAGKAGWAALLAVHRGLERERRRRCS